MREGQNRREFLKASVAVGLALGALTKLVAFSKAAVAEALALVDLTGKKRTDAANKAAIGILAGLGYVENVEKAEKAGKIHRTDKPNPSGGTFPAKAQRCMTCALMEPQYVNGNKPGKCMLVPGVLVHPTGYCNSYSVNPKAKA